MEHLEINKAGFFVHKWNGDIREYIRKPADELTILARLRDTCKIAEGTTLGDIFRLVENNNLLSLFISQYSWCRAINEFHEQAKEPIVSEDAQKLKSLNIYWHPEVKHFIEKIKHPFGLRERVKAADFQLYPSFHGIGEDGINYSVSYSPMYELRDVPVVLDTKFTIYENFEAGKKQEKILESERDFTFLEVLDAIYWDISFCGGPQDNKDFIDSLKQTMDDFTNELNK